MSGQTTSLIAALTAVLLAGCSGAGAGIKPTPPVPLEPPPPPAPPVDDTSVELLDHPATQEFPVATSGPAIRIRYDASRNQYEIKTERFDWAALVDPPDPHKDGPNRYFLIAGQPPGSLEGSVWIAAHYRSPDPGSNYRYSNLLGWYQPSNTEGEAANITAFGVPTSAAGIPVAGQATFEGPAMGAADVANDGWGAIAETPMGGKVRLSFDFAAGTLTGSLNLATTCDCSTQFSIPPMLFTNTIFAKGSTTYSGRFLTDAPGANSFSGLFTGPQGQELIGSWHLPFVFSDKNHQAWGAWIAKRGN